MLNRHVYHFLDFRELANQTHQAAVEISGFLPTSVSSVPVIVGASEKVRG